MPLISRCTYCHHELEQVLQNNKIYYYCFSDNCTFRYNPEAKIRLNLGCGNKLYLGHINIDINKQADKKLDLNKYPYPFADGSVDEVIMEHSLEHLKDADRTLAEIYRILKKGGIFKLITPHYSYSLAHPQHKAWYALSFTGYCRSYLNIRFSDVIEPTLNYTRLQHPLIRIFGYVISKLANMNKPFCERIWCYLVGGFEEMRFMVKKDGKRF